MVKQNVDPLEVKLPKSHWRSVFGYAIAVSWVLHSITIVIVILYSTFLDSQVMGVFLTHLSALEASLTTQWILALSVLGINITSPENKDDSRSLFQRLFSGTHPESKK